jgi:hypothetical protein
MGDGQMDDYSAIAKVNLKQAGDIYQKRSEGAGGRSGHITYPPEQLIQQAIAAALIALAEQAKVQNEHLEHIRNHLGGIAAALIYASGAVKA